MFPWSVVLGSLSDERLISSRVNAKNRCWSRPFGDEMAVNIWPLNVIESTDGQPSAIPMNCFRNYTHHGNGTTGRTTTPNVRPRENNDRGDKAKPSDRPGKPTAKKGSSCVAPYFLLLSTINMLVKRGGRRGKISGPRKPTGRTE
ncbi:hypothetical protein AVEN_244699-1 [Araneus ventricosus]|uniref:Uncharacterized protein n=1 Tax=Araneus ventricosus TaxID=182803 RepID=A0A4Y2TZA5_ARAVE|nr:hypothetical protein AVEN_244699-1 [Araneus ventricosus]